MKSKLILAQLFDPNFFQLSVSPFYLFSNFYPFIRKFRELGPENGEIVLDGFREILRNLANLHALSRRPSSKGNDTGTNVKFCVPPSDGQASRFTSNRSAKLITNLLIKIHANTALVRCYFSSCSDNATEIIKGRMLAREESN